MVLYVVKIYLIYVNSYVLALENFNFKNDFSMGYSGGPKARKITKFLVLRIRSHLTVYSSHFLHFILLAIETHTRPDYLVYYFDNNVL